MTHHDISAGSFAVAHNGTPQQLSAPEIGKPWIWSILLAIVDGAAKGSVTKEPLGEIQRPNKTGISITRLMIQVSHAADRARRRPSRLRPVLFQPGPHFHQAPSRIGPPYRQAAVCAAEARPRVRGSQ
jgi:hypothetical protein